MVRAASGAERARGALARARVDAAHGRLVVRAVVRRAAADVRGGVDRAAVVIPPLDTEVDAAEEALAPGLDLEALESHVAAMQWVCRGDPRGAPIGALPLRERFHWLAHPRSAVLVVSEVHAGLSEDLDATLDHLFARLVSR